MRGARRGGTLALALAAACGGKHETTSTSPPESQTPASIALEAGGGQTASVGAAVAVAPAVIVKDEHGSPVRGVTVLFSPLHGTSSLDRTAVVTGSDGIAAVGTWTLGYGAGRDTAEAYPQQNSTLPGAPVYFVAVATPGPPSSITRYAGDGQVGDAGMPIPVRPAVRVADAHGNGIAGITVRFAPDSASGTVAGAMQTTDSTGLAVVGGWTLGPGIGTQTLIVTGPDSLGLGTQTFHVAVIYAGSRFGIASGDAQVAEVGMPAAAPLSVVVQRAAGAPVAGVSVAFRVDDPADGLGPTAAVKSDTVVTDSSGRAAVSFLPAQEGDHTVTATAVGYAPVVFHVRSASVADRTQCELAATGTAYCWGRNSEYEAGNGPTNASPALVGPVAGGLAFTMLATGAADHTCALAASGQAYCWGRNAFGEVGDGTSEPEFSPTPVAGGLTFATLAVGATQSCGITGAGSLACWGWPGRAGFGNGVLGVAVGTPQSLPAGGAQFVQVAVGDDHACAIAADGAMYCWGSSAGGQLGSGPNVVSHPFPEPIGDGRQYVAVSVGQSTSCAVAADGTAYCWGQGDLGNGDADGAAHAVQSPVAVSTSVKFLSISVARGACGVGTDYHVYCWGAGTTAPGNLPVQISTTLLANAVDVHRDHVCARALSGQPFCWGDNSEGQLGIGTRYAFADTATPVPWGSESPAPGVAVTLIAMTPVNQTATAGSLAPATPTVRALDATGGRVSGATVAFQVVAGGGSIASASATTSYFQDASPGGWTLGPVPGVNRLRATVAGGASVTFTVVTH